MTPPPNLQELIDVVRQDFPTEQPLDQLSTATGASDSGFRSGGGLAAEVLAELGLDRDTGRATIIRMLSRIDPS